MTAQRNEKTLWIRSTILDSIDSIELFEFEIQTEFIYVSTFNARL